jgi:hypothetical protein
MLRLLEVRLNLQHGFVDPIGSINYTTRTESVSSRCNERLKPKTEGSKLLGYTGLRGGTGYLRIETIHQ